MQKIICIIKWISKKLSPFKHSFPFIFLGFYTIIGAAIFRYYELNSDELRRKNYRKSTEYAFTQVF